jgi:hypothetical protein
VTLQTPIVTPVVSPSGDPSDLVLRGTGPDSCRDDVAAQAFGTPCRKFSSGHNMPRPNLVYLYMIYIYVYLSIRACLHFGLEVSCQGSSHRIGASSFLKAIFCKAAMNISRTFGHFSMQIMDQDGSGTVWPCELRHDSQRLANPKFESSARWAALELLEAASNSICNMKQMFPMKQMKLR